MFKYYVAAKDHLHDTFRVPVEKAPISWGVAVGIVLLVGVWFG